MSNRDDLLAVLVGRKPQRIPFIPIGFWDEKTMHKLVPPDCWDENTSCVPADEPPRDRFSAEPRTAESRRSALRMARYLDMATLGAGKGAVFPFGHGGPGEIQPRVVERSPQHKILEYEGGHRRKYGYNPHSIRYYNFPVREEADLDRLELPDMRDAERFQDIAADCALFKEQGFAATGSIQGFFSGIHNSFMDFQDTMVNLLLQPGFMKRLTEMLAGMSLAAVEMLMDRGVEIINVCDDLGNASGLLMSPQLFREFFLPWYERLVGLVHERGGWVHLHSHGNIAPLLPDLAAIGIDVINPFDWEENPDLPGLIQKYGKKVVFCGGCVGDLYRHSREEVRFFIRRACALAAVAERGYILLVSGITESLSIEDWQAWRTIIAEAREGSP